MSEHRKYILASTSWPREIWARGDDKLEDEIGLDFGAGSSIYLKRYPYNGGSWKIETWDDAWNNLPLLQDLLKRAAKANWTVADMVKELRFEGFTPDWDYHGGLSSFTPTLEELKELALSGDVVAITKLYALASEKA